MSAKTIWKLDDHNNYPTNCFPAHGLARRLNEGAGSWVVAYTEEQVEKLQSSFKSKNEIFQNSTNENNQSMKRFKEKKNILDAAYLMQKHHVNNPLDLCSVNVADSKLNFIKKEELLKFKNVAYVNAAENLLPLRPFSHFVNLRELELPVNGIKNIQLDFKDFPNLQVLDLSYNYLGAKDVLALGVLKNLKVLTLTGNNLTSIHADMARPFITFFENKENQVVPRFSKLEVLYLDNNNLSDLSTFASLAALPQLQELNLDKNGIEVIPHLKVVGDRVVSETHSSLGPHISVASSDKKSRISIENEKEIDNSDAKEFDAHKSEARNISPVLPGSFETASSPNPPFKNLRVLSVSNNFIKEEECVLAVAAWPRLKHLVLCNNPLVETKKGEPPLLSHYLRERLGVSIHRFEKNTALPKPHLIISNGKDRKVKNQIPKIPKQPVDVLINSFIFPEMIETSFEKNKFSALLDSNIESTHLNGSNEAQKIPKEEQVFLTQINEEIKHQQKHETNKKKMVEEKKKKLSSELLNFKEDKYQDYHLLMNVKEDECSLEDAGIQGNVKLLNKMIKHPHLFCSPDHSKLDFVPHVNSLSKSKEKATMTSAQETTKTNVHPKQNQLSQHLYRLRARPVIDVEIPLSDALLSIKNQHLSHEAEALLEEIEKKYRIVREESIKTSQHIKSVLEESKKMIQGLSE